MIYAVPFVLALALFGLRGFAPNVPVFSPRPAPPRARAWPWPRLLWSRALLSPPLDSYRRVDLQGVRDGPLVLGLCRESLRTARRLERGETVTFDLSAASYVWGESDPGAMARMRWFLREGWGDKPHYGQGPSAHMVGDRASILVPVRAPRDLALTLAFEGEVPEYVSLALEGKAWTAGSSPGRDGSVRTILPASFLERGDNVLVLRGVGHPVALRSLTVAPAR